MNKERFYELKNEIHKLREKDLQTSLKVQAQLNRMDVEEKTTFEIWHFNDEFAILKRGGKFYWINHRDIGKPCLREYADVEPEAVEKDEDGDLWYYYDDECWVVDAEVLEGYLADYVKHGYEIKVGDKNIEDGDVFLIQEGDEYFEQVERIKQESIMQKTYTLKL